MEVLYNTGQLKVNARDCDQRTPLMVAAAAGKADACEWCLRRGGKVNETDAFGMTALSYAVANNHVSVECQRWTAIHNVMTYPCWFNMHAIQPACVRLLNEEGGILGNKPDLEEAAPPPPPQVIPEQKKAPENSGGCCGKDGACIVM